MAHVVTLERFKNPKRQLVFSNMTLWTAAWECVDDFYNYIQWIEDNKLKEAKLFGAEGAIAQLDKMRMPSWQGFGFYLRTTKKVFDKYQDLDAEWNETFQFISDTMHAISLEGAAAGLLKESIVQRKLGLADKTEISKTQKRVVILHTPDNGRTRKIEDAETTKLID